MKRAFQILGGIAAAVFSLLMLAMALLAATSTQHKLRAHEREHLAAAVQFLRHQAVATGAIPDREEFGQWARRMDTKGYRFEGNGFTLDKRCGSNPSEFCINFSAGGDLVT